MIINPFAGPGGWCVAAARLGLAPNVGIELDAAACATRAAAGHLTIRADVSAFPVDRLAGRVTGGIFSPPCTTFSSAGNRAGNAVTDVLDASVRDAFEGHQTRAAHRREMAAMLGKAWWPSPKLTRAQRSAKIWPAVRSASLVVEPARFIAACRPEWVALEQVPAVLPLWRVYADELGKLGYSTWCGKLNAADYGVPQTRERAILIASRVRRVGRPPATHYDPRKGMQLFGAPWVSMAAALGWGASARPGPAVTAGGVATGGAEPFARGGRDMLATERDAGRWALVKDAQANTALRPAPAPAPAPTISFGHAAGDMRWVLRTSFGKPAAGPKNTGTGSHGTHEMDPFERPAHAVTTKAKDWAAWVQERPATTVQGDPRIGRPGHKDRAGGESQFEQDSVRITVAEAAVLQSFPAGYPWQGSKGKQFEQVGNAIPPLLAEHVLAMAAGIARSSEVAA